MSFPALMQQSTAHAARTFAGVTAATAGAWFGTTATAAPAARSGFSVAVSDVVKGAPRSVRDPLTGTLTTPAGTIRVSFATSALSFVPVSLETLCIVGATRAAGTLYRIQSVEEIAGIYEMELKEESQALT